MKVKVEVLIDFNMNGGSFEAVKEKLSRGMYVPFHALVFSDDLEATIEDFKFTITEVKE